MEIQFDFDQGLAKDYLYFYETFLTPDFTRQQAALIVKLLKMF